MRDLSNVSLQALQRQSERHLVDARNAMWQAIAGLSVLALLIAALCWYTLSRLTCNVRRAATVAANIAQGQLDDQVSAAGRDETGQLLDTMRQMQGNCSASSARKAKWRSATTPARSATACRQTVSPVPTPPWCATPTRWWARTLQSR